MHVAGNRDLSGQLMDQVRKVAPQKMVGRGHRDDERDQHERPSLQPRGRGSACHRGEQGRHERKHARVLDGRGDSGERPGDRSPRFLVGLVEDQRGPHRGGDEQHLAGIVADDGRGLNGQRDDGDDRGGDEPGG